MENNQPNNLPPAEPSAGQPVKENKVLGILKNGLLFVALIIVVFLSFWLSFQLGKRVFSVGSRFEEQKIRAEIPEPPPSIRSLQKLGIGVSAEVKVAAVSSEIARPKLVITRVKSTRSRKIYKAGYHYKLQAGLFDEIDAAHELSSAIQAAGFDVFIKKVGHAFRVQAGAFTSKKQALKMKASLAGKGFKARIVYE